MINGIENIDYVKCEICGKCQKAIIKHLKIHNITVNEYKKIYNKEVECENSKKLRSNNRKNTIIEKYGVDNISQLPEIKNKIIQTYKKTCLNKYGVDNIRKDPDFIKKIQEKRSVTMLEKYGTDQMMHIPEAKEKMIKSIKNLWQDENSIYNSENYGKFSNIQPNKAEQKILDFNIPEIQYTGNFSHWITFKNNRRKNPDFIIKPFSKTKKVIELFGGKNFYHFEKEEKELIKLYKDSGYKCLIIWDYELSKHNLQKIKNDILNFINN